MSVKALSKGLPEWLKSYNVFAQPLPVMFKMVGNLMVRPCIYLYIKKNQTKMKVFVWEEFNKYQTHIHTQNISSIFKYFWLPFL